MKAHVVVGLYQGIIDQVAVSTDYDRALAKRNELDQQYGIERYSDGTHDHPENEADIIECKIK